MNDAATDTSTTAVTAVQPRAHAVERAGTLPTQAEQNLAAKDRTLTSAAVIEAARHSLAEITEPSAVGEHAGARRVSERLITHLFECALAGYRGWRWAVTVARPPRGRSATICEMELLPGEDALLAPAWVPWADRLRPGDVTRSDRLPLRETDERLEPGWEATGDDEGDAVALDELDLGRARVLSPEGVSRAAQRWYDGDHGPEAEGVRKAHATCSSCGFFIRMAGPLRNVFGICANEWAVDDGRVVSLDHGCGAHSETDLPDEEPEWPVTPARLDENAMEPLGTDGLSIRDGHQQAEPLADDGAAASEDGDASRAEGDPATADSPAAERADAPGTRGRTDTGAESAKDSTETDADPAPTADQPPVAETADARTEAPEAHEPEAARGAQAGEEPEAESKVQVEESRSSDESSEQASAEDRAAAARDAVAELVPKRPSQRARDPETAVTSLAELEAHLPSRS